MKHVFVVGLLWLCLALDPATVIVTNALTLRQSYGRRRLSLAHKSSFPRTRGLRNRDELTNSRRPTLQLSPRHDHDYGHGHRWARRCSSSSTDPQDLNFDVPDRVAIDDATDVDEDADEDEDATFRDAGEIEKFFEEAERDANRMNFPRGKPEGYYVTDQYPVPPNGFENLVTATATPDVDAASVNSKSNGEEKAKGITQEEVDRLGISGTNITLPIALMLLDGETYPSLSRARKACRKGRIVVNRGPLVVNPETGKKEFDQETCSKGRVIDRVYPGDVIGIQCRMHGGFYPGFDTIKPPFELPVLYEDSHFAIVNKPAGIVCYSQRDDNHGVMTVRHALPFVLKPPKRGTSGIYLRPVGVHRLDKPTSGLLVIAKTKPAIVDISKQFVERRVKKTYTAIVNGIPSELDESSITGEEAKKLGVDVGVDELPGDESESKSKWQLIDHALDEKSAVTIWKPLEYSNSLKAQDGTLTLVELKPKTGRYHQLRRHMAWVRECPLVGDTTYDGGGSDATNLRGRGLFLCSNRVVLEHPYYNTEKGRAEWEKLPDNDHQKWANGMIRFSEDGTTLEVHASIDLPVKFRSFLATERRRYDKLGDT